MVVFAMAVLAVPRQDAIHAAPCLPLNLIMGSRVRAIPAFMFTNGWRTLENEKLVNIFKKFRNKLKET